MSLGCTKDKSKQSFDFESPTCSKDLTAEIVNCSNKKCWTNIPEKETFHSTVLVNYRYPQVVKYRRHNTSSIPKRCILNKIIKSMSTSKLKDEHSKISLLFNISLDSFRKTVVVNEPIQMEIRNESYVAPQPRKAIAEESIVEMVIAKEQAEVVSKSSNENLNSKAISAHTVAFDNVNRYGKAPQIALLDCSLPVGVQRSKTLINIIPSAGTSAPHVTPITSKHKLNQKPSEPKETLKPKPPANTIKQRQLELHRYRVEVEQKRLQLLDLKLQRERDEMLRERVLFEKDLEFKEKQLKKLKAEYSTA